MGPGTCTGVMGPGTCTGVMGPGTVRHGSWYREAWVLVTGPDGPVFWTRFQDPFMVPRIHATSLFIEQFQPYI